MQVIRTAYGRLKALLTNLLTEESSPKRLAIAFGVGAACGPPPIFFLHLASAAALAWLLRLNKVVAVVGCNVVNPWTMIFFLYLDLRAGAWMLGQTPPPWPSHMSLPEVKAWIEPYIVLTFVGSIPVSLITGLVSGAVVFAIVRTIKRDRGGETGGQ